MDTVPELLTRRDRAPSWLKRAQQRGLLTGVLPGVYLRSDLVTEPIWRARAVMAWRPDAVITGALAAHLTFWRELEVGAVDVATRTTIDRAGFRFVDRSIPASLCSSYGYLRITVPALTALDLATTHGVEVIDRALRSRLVTVEQLAEALDVSSHRPGNADRRRLLVGARTRPWSAAERLAHRLLREAGIGGWVANRPIRIDRLWTLYLDIAFDAVGLAVEIDGYELHSRRDVFEDDRERQNRIVLAGWTVLRFTYRQLTEQPRYVVETIRRGVAVAGRRQSAASCLPP